ncbi:MAG: YedE-related selenium metabolism membrane protein [Spirochaetes bacterium]|nr:MAG: YedE-related selenium metabolism membrane protein [Spirochaetota bacterium]
MKWISEFLGSVKGILLTGAFIGVIAPLLQNFGNPPNMGICVACMERDIAGALGFHRAAVVQYLRPEIIGLVLGAAIAAVMFGEFRARSGSAPLMRFMLGFFAMTGALVFLGCPWRAFLRLAGGDFNALTGLAGMLAGVWAGVFFIKKGFSLGSSRRTPAMAGWVFPVLMIGLLVLLLANMYVSYLPESVIYKEQGKFAPFFSLSGPGSQHAPLIISFGAALAIGFLAQRSRFCTMGAIRDVILIKDMHLMWGILALVLAAFGTNLMLDQFKPGFTGQPIAHTEHIWNFLGMGLAGLAYALVGGCPGRQLFLAGEGDGDSAVFVIGMISGAGFAHNFAIASSAAGTGLWGPAAVIVGLVFCLGTGFFMRQKI